jgi:alpha-beta hydrolase superfamily lysophospholipase
MLTKSDDIKGIIASSAFLQLAFEPPKVKLAAGKILQKIAPSITMGNELNPEDLSRDQKAVKDYIEDPLVHDKISPNFSLTFIDKGKWAIENAQKLKVPMLMIHGTEDHIIDYQGSVAFAENSKFATVKLYEGGYHELHHDLCKKEVITDVIDWLNEQL